MGDGRRGNVIFTEKGIGELAWCVNFFLGTLRARARLICCWEVIFAIVQNWSSRARNGGCLKIHGLCLVFWGEIYAWILQHLMLKICAHVCFFTQHLGNRYIKCILKWMYCTWKLKIIGGQREGTEQGGGPPGTSISYLITYVQILGLFTVVPPPPPTANPNAHLGLKYIFLSKDLGNREINKPTEKGGGREEE